MRGRTRASLRGLRQFQFFGVPSVGPWRELRRLREDVCSSEIIERARKAADGNDWEVFMCIMGGVGCERANVPIKLVMQWSDKESEYGEQVGDLIFGIECFGVIVETRSHIWVVVPKQPSDDDEAIRS